MRIRVTTTTTFACPGKPWERQVTMTKGDYDANEFPTWALKRGHEMGVVVSGLKGKAGKNFDPDLDKAKQEQAKAEENQKNKEQEED